jgi:SAM-dependent methyltransferase
VAESLDKANGIGPTTSQLALPNATRKNEDGDFSVLVVLIGQNAFALTPLEYNDLEATWKLAGDSELTERLRDNAKSTFEQIRGTTEEYLGYLRINLHVDRASSEISTINADPTPRLLYPQGTSPWDDEVIAKTFPGGHAAFFEVILSTRLARIPQYILRNEGCARQQGRLARLYYTVLATNVTQTRLSPFVGKYDYNGTVLDCCSGSGEFARFAIEAGVQAKYTALDYSVEMTALPISKKLYEQPFIIGPVQEILSKAPMHDHVVCFGSFHLLQPFDFYSTVSQMFLRARKSVSFDVDDLSQTYIQKFPDASSEKCWEKLEYNHNNVSQAFRFGVPVGWRAVLNGERRFAYRSLVMGEDVYTHSFRFERVE